jgi:hypothetical protein
VHVNLDPAGQESVATLERAVEALRDRFEVLASDLDKYPPTRREIELIRGGDEAGDLAQAAEAACAAALSQAGATASPRAVAVSFLSSGSEEDARGVVRAFGLADGLRAIVFEDENVAVFVLEREVLQRTTPAKLQTALEAALNREVRFVEA